MEALYLSMVGSALLCRIPAQACLENVLASDTLITHFQHCSMV
jgi:hypothetical protein